MNGLQEGASTFHVVSPALSIGPNTEQAVIMVLNPIARRRPASDAHSFLVDGITQSGELVLWWGWAWRAREQCTHLRSPGCGGWDGSTITPLLQATGAVVTAVSHAWSDFRDRLNSIDRKEAGRVLEYMASGYFCFWVTAWQENHCLGPISQMTRVNRGNGLEPLRLLDSCPWRPRASDCIELFLWEA